MALQTTAQGQDPFNLARFVEAQQGVYEQARLELMNGRKQSHWMWFIFPQISGLGRSDMAQRYAISGTEEASRYLNHPILGARLRECTRLVLAIENAPIGDIFPWPDDLKFHSCMTLFALVAPDEPLFSAALDKFFDGRLDEETRARL